MPRLWLVVAVALKFVRPLVDALPETAEYRTRLLASISVVQVIVAPLAESAPDETLDITGTAGGVEDAEVVKDDCELVAARADPDVEITT